MTKLPLMPTWVHAAEIRNALSEARIREVA